MKNKKVILIILSIIILVVLISVLLFFINNKQNKLPKPEVTSGVRGEFGIDKNVNEETIDNY